MRVWILLSLMIAFVGCANERVVEKRVPVVIQGPPQIIKIDPELLQTCSKTDIPELVTYGDGLELWAIDRACLDIANGKLKAIESLQ